MLERVRAMLVDLVLQNHVTFSSTASFMLYNVHQLQACSQCSLCACIRVCVEEGTVLRFLLQSKVSLPGLCIFAGPKIEAKSGLPPDQLA